jgi:hypothetical protein
VPLALDGKTVFFGIPGHSKTLKTGNAFVLIATSMTKSTSKTASF